MFIKNIKTGVTQECSNLDVIKICKKHPDEYMIAEKKEEMKDSGNKKDISKMKVPDLKALAKEKGIEGADTLNKEELLKVLEDVVADE